MPSRSSIRSYLFKRALSIDKLLKRLAYSESFLEAVAEAAAERGMTTANTVVALYRHEFRGRWPSRSPLTFLGSFDYFPIPAPVSRRARKSKPDDYRYLEYEHQGARRFWSIELRGVQHVIQYGPIGLSGQEHRRAFKDRQTARAQFERAIKEKEKAGYKVRPAAATRRQEEELRR